MSQVRVVETMKGPQPKLEKKISKTKWQTHILVYGLGLYICSCPYVFVYSVYSIHVHGHIMAPFCVHGRFTGLFSVEL